MTEIDEHARPFTELPWVRFLGLEMTASSPGRVTLRLEPRAEHLNQNGTVAAPILFALAESAGAAALVMGFLDLLGLTYSVVRWAEMEFVAAARGPVESTGVVDPAEVERVRAVVERGEPVDVPIPADVVDGTGRVVARVKMVMAVRPPR